MSAEDNSWRTPSFRQNVVQKIEDAVRSSGMNPSKNSLEMENHVFQKAKTKEDYLSYVARLILHVREMSSGNQPVGGGVPGVGGGPLGPPGPGPAQVTATNLLQSLNQRPGLQPKLPVQGMNQMGGPMGVPVSNQMGMPMGGSQINTSVGAPMGPSGNMPPMMSSVGGPVNPIPGQMGNQMPNQMGNAPMPPQMGPNMPNQMTHLQRKDNTDKEDEEEVIETEISHAAAMHHLSKVLAYFKQRGDVPFGDMVAVRYWRDRAAQELTQRENHPEEVPSKKRKL